MKIISHRGKFSKKSSDNDIPTILETDKLSPSYIEIDVQLNNEGKAVIVHNNITNYENVHHNMLPRLDYLLNNKIISRLLVEVKQPGIAETILKLVRPDSKVSFTSFSLKDAKYIKKNSNYESFIMQRIHPFGLFKKCYENNLDGIGINKNWFIILPFIYIKCRANNKKLFIYTINNSILAKLTSKLYKEVYICTDETKKFANY